MTRLHLLTVFLSLASAIRVYEEVRPPAQRRTSALTPGGSDLLRYTTTIFKTPTKGDVVTDSYLSHSTKIPLDSKLDYVVTGKTSTGTDFGIRFSYNKVDLQTTNTLAYAAPIYNDGWNRKTVQMVWHSGWGVDMPVACKKYANKQYEFFECMRERNEVTDMNANDDKNCRTSPTTFGSPTHPNSTVLNTRGLCLGAENPEDWWMRRIFTNDYKTSFFWINAIDQYTLSDCGTGSCTPSGQIRTFEKEWPSGTNTALFFNPGPIQPDYELLIAPEFGCDFQPCTLTKPGESCKISDVDTVTIVRDSLEDASNKNIMILASCDGGACQAMEVFNYRDTLGLTSEFPYMKWLQAPGPEAVRQASTLNNLFSPEVRLRGDWMLSQGYDQERAQYSHFSNKQYCRRTAPQIVQDIKSFRSRGDPIKRCGSVTLEYGNVTCHSLKIGSGFSCSKYDYLTSRQMCSYKPSELTAKYDGCTSGELTLKLDIQSEEVVVDPPPGVSLTGCTIALDGFYGMDNGAVLVIGGCSQSGPSKLVLTQLDLYFLGDSKTYTTVLGLGETKITFTAMTFYNELILTEQFSGEVVTIPNTLANSDDAFTPDIIPPGQESGGSFFDFFKTGFGSIFAVILIVSAVLILGVVLCSCVGANKGSVDKKQ